jgi:hypothetical protein
MSETAETEVLDIPELDQEAWQDYAVEQGWSDGLPLVMPTEAAVARMMAGARGDNEPFPPISPRQVMPTLNSLAANAVMAGAKPEYFPAILAALRGVLAPEYNLHGTMATTHPCAPMVMVNGPLRQQLGINCGTNCFGQGWRANASIGRALQLILLNVGGGRPGVMDRSTQGSPAKYAFCFGENEEESPWAPFHVRRGFAKEDSVVTVMSGEPPHNINDHASTSAEGLITTFAHTIAQPGANTIYGKGPYFVVVGPEHAATFARDGWSVEKLRDELWERARVPLKHISEENLAQYAATGHKPTGDFLTICRNPDDIHIAMAGGPGKHSAFIPSFGGTAVISTRVKPPA